ncbi:MAG: hypothetical protein AAB732_00970 [Patescibacteria group bacterium]
MNIQHKQLANGCWNKLTFFEQMANIGSEVERTIKWREKNTQYSQQAFERALELLSFTIDDPKNKTKLKEILRCRELWCDYIVGDNQYNQNDALWQNYFFAFNWAARAGV